MATIQELLMSDYVDESITKLNANFNELNDHKLESTELPTKLSEFENDTHFITSETAPVQSVNGEIGDVVLNPDNLDDTLTVHKFVSATEKEQISSSHTHSGLLDNPHQVTKTQVGLENVPNLDPSIAVAQTHTHSNKSILDNIEEALTTLLKSSYDSAVSHIGLTNNPHSVTKDQVGLGSVPNLDTTSAVNNQHTHSNKSTLDNIQEALTTILKGNYDTAYSHVSNTSNPHSVTKAQVGLTNVPDLNTTDAVNNQHTHSNKSTLDNIQEAFTTALKSNYDTAYTNNHTHSNKSTLDNIQEALTTILKGYYDAAYSHISLTNNPHAVTAAQVGSPSGSGTSSGTNTGDEDVTSIKTKLGAATAIADGYLKKEDFSTFNGKQAALGFTPEDVSNKSNDITTDAASTTKYPSVKAIKDYADGLVAGLLDYRGAYNASGNTFPATGGSGTAGAILKGDTWAISVAGTLGGEAVQVGDFIISNTDTPGQTATNWDLLNRNISYVPEDAANKVTSISAASTDIQYASAKLVYDQLAGKQASGSYEVNTNKENTTIDTSTTKYPTVNLLKTGLDTRTPFHGIVDRSLSSLSVSSLTVTLTKISNYTAFVGGTLISVTANKTVDIADSTGLHYITMDSSGNLASSTSVFDLLSFTVIPIAIVWRIAGVSSRIWDERHTSKRNLAWHLWAHKTIGARYVSGLTGTFTTSTISVTSGEIEDEDIANTTSGTITTVTHVYRATGGVNELYDSTPSTTVIKTNGTNPVYDLNGVLTPLDNNTYGNLFMYGTNDCTSKVIDNTNTQLYCVLGQGQYTSVANAQAAPNPTFNSGFTTAEIKLLYRVIIRRTAGSPAGLYIQADDLRAVSTGPAISGSTGTTTAGTVTFSPVTGIDATNVQAAIEELNLEKQVVLESGVNIKSINGTSLLGSGDVTISAGGYTIVQVNTTPYNVTATSLDNIYEVDTTDENIVINIPTAVDNQALLTFKKLVAANQIILTPAGAETIDGEATHVIDGYQSARTLYSNDANWKNR